MLPENTGAIALETDGCKLGGRDGERERERERERVEEHT